MIVNSYTYYGFTGGALTFSEYDRVSAEMFGKMLNAKDVKQLFMVLNDKYLFEQVNLNEPVQNCWLRVFRCRDGLLYAVVSDYDPHDETGPYRLNRVFTIDQATYNKLWKKHSKVVEEARQRFTDSNSRFMLIDRYLGIAYGSRSIGQFKLKRAQVKMCKLLGNYYKFAYMEDRVD